MKLHWAATRSVGANADPLLERDNHPILADRHSRVGHRMAALAISLLWPRKVEVERDVKHEHS